MGSGGKGRGEVAIEASDVRGVFGGEFEGIKVGSPAPAAKDGWRRTGRYEPVIDYIIHFCIYRFILRDVYI